MSKNVLGGIVSALVNPIGFATGEATKKVAKAAGVGDTITDVVSTVSGGTGSGTKFVADTVNKIEEGRVATNKAEGDFRTAQAKQNADALKQVKDRKAQEKAQRKASEDLTVGRAKQARRRKGVGRKGTILTDSLGDVGGEDNQGRKTLLGL